MIKIIVILDGMELGTMPSVILFENSSLLKEFRNGLLKQAEYVRDSPKSQLNSYLLNATSERNEVSDHRHSICTRSGQPA